MLGSGAARSNETAGLVIPAFVKCRGASEMLTASQRSKFLGDDYVIGYFRMAEIEDISKSSSVEYVSLAGNLRCLPLDIRGLFSPASPPDAPAAIQGSVLVGIVDRNCRLLCQNDADFAGRTIVYWNRMPADQEPGHGPRPAGKSRSRGSSSVHGSVVAGIIHKIVKDGSFVVVDTELDQIDVAIAVDFISALAALLNVPAVVNLSANSAAGPHDGRSLFEEILSGYVNDRFVIVVSAGNQGNRNLPVEFDEKCLGDGSVELKLHVARTNLGQDFETSVDLWFDGEIPCEVSVFAPGAVPTAEVSCTQSKMSIRDGACIYLSNDLANPLNGCTNVFVMIKAMRLADTHVGDWTVRFRFSDPGPFVCDGWLALAPQSRASFSSFVSENKTISSPTTARGVLSVGAYSEQGVRRLYRSRGPTRDNRNKPDVFVRLAHPTSWAAAIVTGLTANVLSTGAQSENVLDSLPARLAESSEQIELTSGRR
jgi:hypothetical protein